MTQFLWCDKLDDKLIEENSMRVELHRDILEGERL